MKSSYELNQISQTIDLMTLIVESARQMDCKPFEVFVSAEVVAKKLSISRYYARKLLASLVENGVFSRMGNRYRFNPENHLSFILAEGNHGY